MPSAVLVRPDDPCGTGVLTIRGSSGSVDADRARLFADHGALAMSFSWFEQPGPALVPLERLTEALDQLAAECDRIALVGASFGAEAALTVASLDPRVDAVVGCAPTHVTWAYLRDDGSQVSKWTWRGEPLPFVPFDLGWQSQSDPPEFVGFYRHSLEVAGAGMATIEVERIVGDVVLIAGGDDRVWPSLDSAEAIRDRRAAHGRPTTVVTAPGAGHYLQLPGEPEAAPGRSMVRGGTPEENRRLGGLAWPHIVNALRLHP